LLKRKKERKKGNEMFLHIIGVERMTFTSIRICTADCQVSLWKKFASSFILWTRGQQIFEKPSSHLKVSGTRRVTWSKLRYPCSFKKRQGNIFLYY